ncbi:Tol-Pal system beta propeller repeat protein TolB [Candidatus Palibaumannia cicadellinicola]|uniref:Tol-Pal system protein TolB n=1 Tax=Candidatus Palibaumannia cicadellinicola TaxID=186490 RepID=A0A088MXB0_9GAMM|nr:Tol-Pal system beta propeller repeat protein TolB [Candidatus Baumannia cicadellinicola]AIN47000.1 tolB protein precursor, periplasmic protein involved in the tonb-independent uptake of group A colicins [Candidatus Baumannia cicadellinicola]
MKQTFLVALSIFLLWSSVLYAEVRIEITKGVDSARPIGVVPFKWCGLGPAPEDISGIISDDLRHSGKFNPIAKSRMPQQPTISSEVIAQAWMALGIDVVIVGQVEPSADDNYVVYYQLMDTSGNTGVILSQNHYKVAKRWLRYAAHTASDEIFEKLTGIKGVFRTRIAYVVHINGECTYPYELRIADYDGHYQTLVHRSSEPLMSPAWFPNGHKLAYVTFENGCSSLVIQTLESGVIRQITSFPQHNGAPAFSPDGSKLAFALSKTGSLNLYVMDLTSGQINQVTDGRSNNTEPSWFPDNHTIAYTSDQGGNPQVYKIDLNGGHAQRLSWEGSKNQDANVSTDGKFIVMVNSNNNGVQHIAKLNLVTGDVQVLTDTFLDETPSIAPNGTMIIYSYSASQALGSFLQLVSTDGSFKARILATDGLVTCPAWSPYL